MLEPDYNLYMDIQQAINLEIHERFEEEAIEFAYPTQTLFVQRGESEPPTVRQAQGGCRQRRSSGRVR